MKKTPLALVKERFESKSKLVEAVKLLTTSELWIDRLSQEKGLEHVSNTKLLRLHATLTEVKEKFGTRAKLIDALLEAEKRTKDAGYKSKLEGFPTPRLVDALASASRRAKRAAADATAAAAKPAKKKVPRSKKAQAKELAKAKA